MNNDVIQDQAAYAQAYGQYGFDPAAYDQAYGQYSYYPAAYPEPYGYDPAAYKQGTYGQPPFGQSQPEEANPVLQPISSAEPKGKWENRTTPVVLTMCATVFFVSAAVLITIFFFGKEDASDEGRSLPPLVYSTSSSVTAVPLVPLKPTDASTISPPTGDGPEMLICTYGSRTTVDAVMASDGLCDMAFYDSIYADNRNQPFGGRPFESDLMTFMRATSRYKRTTLGVAFAFHHMNRLGDDLRRANPGLLDVFWQSGIYHTGILDTPQHTTRSEMTTALLRLRVLERLAQTQSALRNRSLTALAAPLPGRQWIYFLDEQFKRLQFIPDLIVAYGHYPYGDNTADNCAIMPPTRLSAVPLPRQFRGSYLYDLSFGPQGVREIERRQLPTRALLSVTMKGRWTKAFLGQPLQFFSRCEVHATAASFGSYTEVCKELYYEYNLRYQPQHYAMLTYENRSRNVFAYDNEEGLAAKLCETKNEAQDVKFGIIVYDVDYDDYSNECGSLNKFGMHSRLKALRKIADYYKRVPSRGFDKALCTKVVS